MPFVKQLFDENFIEYASYVIKDRAIPHIIDGMKPVQRRILQSLFDMDDGKFHKVANVVGHCMQYHPHGDASIYAALVNLANKDLFIEKQGNFGNIFTGDPASASRYIECRTLPLAKKLLYNPELTTFVDSYDGRRKEPVIFPSKFPMILVNGTEGIAVGMATKILPHNFIEVIDAMMKAIRGEEFELLPDFRTGGFVDAREYKDGNGKVLVRAKLDTSDPKRILVTELPFGQTTESLISSIEQAARKNKIKIGGITDFTAEKVEIELTLPRGVHAKEIENALYAFTECESSISVNLLVLHEEKPIVTTTKEIIDFHKTHLLKVLKQELEIEAGHLQDEIHARTLERIFIEERLYKPLEKIATKAGILDSIQAGFKPFKKDIGREITKDDIERLLKIPIRRISLYDIQKMLDELKRVESRLAEVRNHLSNLKKYALAFLKNLSKEYKSSFSRKTEIAQFSGVREREIAERNFNLRYDNKSGYIGYQLTTGNIVAKVSPYDRVLIIKKDGSYSFIPVPEKLFLGKGIIYHALADPEQMEEIVFNILYKDKETNYPYIKRCKITQYILNKEYNLVPETGKLLKLTTKEEVTAVVEFDQGALFREVANEFPVDNFLIKGVKTQGVRLKAKPCFSAKFIKKASTKEPL